MVPSRAIAKELGSTVGDSRPSSNARLAASVPNGIVVTASQRPGRSLRYARSSIAGSRTAAGLEGDGEAWARTGGGRWGVGVHPTAATATIAQQAAALRLTEPSRAP